MPWEIAKIDGKWVVRNKITHRVRGRHPSHARAVAQLHALHANVKE